MKQKFYLCILALCSVFFLPGKVQAEWRLGINGGATWNYYSLDKQYQTDYRYPSQWGGTAGLYTQYNFMDWLGLRVGAYYAQRNYRHTRVHYAEMWDLRYENNYLLFPVTVNFSFGGQKVRGFVNAGVYGGAWLNYRCVGKAGNFVGMPQTKDMDEVLSLNPKDYTLKSDVFGEVILVGLPSAIMPNASLMPYMATMFRAMAVAS